MLFCDSALAVWALRFAAPRALPCLAMTTTHGPQSGGILFLCEPNDRQIDGITKEHNTNIQQIQRNPFGFPARAWQATEGALLSCLRFVTRSETDGLSKRSCIHTTMGRNPTTPNRGQTFVLESGLYKTRSARKPEVCSRRKTMSYLNVYHILMYCIIGTNYLYIML